MLSVEEPTGAAAAPSPCRARQGPGRWKSTIPAGVTDGQRIRLAGQGGQGSGSAPAGDLYLVVRLAPHPRYRVDGRDIYVDLPLAPWEAALGATVAVETPGGEAKVRVKAGTSSGKRLRLRGRGLPNPRGDDRGPVRRGAHHGAAVAHRRRAPSSSRSWPPSRPSTRGGDGDLRPGPDTAASTWRRSPEPPVCTPISSAAWSPSACSTPYPMPPASCGFRPPTSPPSVACSGCAPACPSTTPPSGSWSICSTASPNWRPRSATAPDDTGDPPWT